MALPSDADALGIVSITESLPNLTNLELTTYRTELVNQIVTIPTKLKKVVLNVKDAHNLNGLLSGENLSSLINRNADSLVDLKLDHCGVQGIVNITEPLPNLMSLELINCDIEVVNQIAAKPTMLKKLVLSCRKGDGNSSLISGETMFSLLDINAPTLEEMCLDQVKTESIGLATHFPHLETLTLKDCSQVMVNHIIIRVHNVKKLVLYDFDESVCKDQFYCLLNNIAASLEHAEFAGVRRIYYYYKDKVKKLDKLRYLDLNSCGSALIKTVLVCSADNLETLRLNNVITWNVHIPTPMPNLKEVTYATHCNYNKVDISKLLLKTQAGNINQLTKLRKIRT